MSWCSGVYAEAERPGSTSGHPAFGSQRRDAGGQRRVHPGALERRYRPAGSNPPISPPKSPPPCGSNNSQEELDRSRATTPALAEAAARSEVEQLKRELAGQANRTRRSCGRIRRLPRSGRSGAAIGRNRRAPPARRPAGVMAAVSAAGAASLGGSCRGAGGVGRAASGWGTPPWRGASSTNSAASRSID